MRADDILSLYSFNSLRTMARVREYPLTALRRPELIVALAERLFVPSELARMVDGLAANERAALDVVVQAGGRLRREQFAEALLNSGTIDEVGPPRPRETIDRIAPSTRRFEELCARLTARTLLFSEPHVEGTLAGLYDLGPGAVLFVPGPVLEVLRRQGVGGERRDAHDLPAQDIAVESTPPQIVRGRLIVQPSFTILLLPPLDEPSLDYLSRFTELVRRAEVAEFKLNQEALYNAIGRGITVGAVMAFLEERGEQALPQNVRYTLEAWERSFGQIRVHRQAAVVEGPPDVLDRLASAQALAPLVLRRPRPDRLVLADAAGVERALAVLGELPRITDYSDREGSPFHVTADGIIVVAPDVNHLLLPLALRRVAEPGGDGNFQLTRERVRSAVESAPDGLTGLLKWLRSTAGDLPPELIARLKLWTLADADVQLEQALVLRVPRDLLADLRAFPELAPLLADEYPSDAALVRIAPQQRARLLDVLRQRGLDLPDSPADVTKHS